MVLTAGVAWAYILGQVCAIVTDLMEEPSMEIKGNMRKYTTKSKDSRPFYAILIYIYIYIFAVKKYNFE